MKTSTQVYRELKAAQFTDPQAKALVEILQVGGIVESGAIESELQRIEDYLLAEPFEPFTIEMTLGTAFRIEQSAQCQFTRHGSVRVRPGDGHLHTLNSEHIVRVRKLWDWKSETPWAILITFKSFGELLVPEPMWQLFHCPDARDEAIYRSRSAAAPRGQLSDSRFIRSSILRSKVAVMKKV
jgi:hypothetical protein